MSGMIRSLTVYIAILLAQLPVELKDLLPALLEIGKGPTGKTPAGVTLTPLFNGCTTNHPKVFAEIEEWIVVGHHRLICRVKDEGMFLFDDLADPENLTNIAAKHPGIVGRSLQPAMNV